MNKPCTSDGRAMNNWWTSDEKLWTIYEQVETIKSWASSDQTINKSWTSYEQAMDKSWKTNKEIKSKSLRSNAQEQIAYKFKQVANMYCKN